MERPMENIFLLIGVLGIAISIYAKYAYWRIQRTKRPAESVT
jgi:hypothetical protein